MSKLVGKYAYITDQDSVHYQEWGEIIGFSHGVYHIIMDTDKKIAVDFNREQFKVPTRQWLRYHADKIKRRNAFV